MYIIYIYIYTVHMYIYSHFKRHSIVQNCFTYVPNRAVWNSTSPTRQAAHHRQAAQTTEYQEDDALEEHRFPGTI